MATTSSPVTFTTATTATTASPAPVLKNLLIKDASGNTQIIEVVQTGPGKFVTASGHSIKAAPAGGVKTIIRAPQTGQHTPGQNTVILASPSMGGQVIRAATTSSGATPTTIFKNAQGQRVMTFPAGTLLNSPNTTTILKATNIKTEAGTTTYIQRQPQTVNMNSPQLQNLQQVIQGGQRLYLHTTSGPQLVTTSIQNGQQIATFVTSDPSSPGSNAANILSKQQNFISPILDHTGARKRVDFPSDVSYESKRRKSEKGGLRHFSMKVCEKVRTKGITTYNEVADELVQEFASPNMGMSSIEQQFDQKNIRRRVYDALNVLMAMNIISKEKKEIKWLGLPTNSMQECTTLEKDRQKRIERLKAKTQQLHDLIIQQVAFKSLVERNKEKEKESGPPPPHGSIHLPFLIVNTEKNTVIDCSISSDKMEYLFNFDGTFEIHDDIEVLKRMGFALGLDNNNCSEEQLQQAKKVLPKALEMYIDQIGKRGGDDWRAEFGDLDYDDDSYFADGDVSDNVENIQFIDQATLAQHGGHTMTVDELQMRAAIESLHQESEIADEDDSYDGVEEEDEEDNGELSE